MSLYHFKDFAERDELYENRFSPVKTGTEHKPNSHLSFFVISLFALRMRHFRFSCLRFMNSKTRTTTMISTIMMAGTTMGISIFWLPEERHVNIISIANTTFKKK